MKLRFSHALILCALACSTACGPHFQITAPEGFVVLNESEPYDFRATTPDGLVLAVREFDNTKEYGDLDFWVQAIQNEMRLDQGYALLDTSSIKTNSGLVGNSMHFGLDRDDEDHEYIVTIFVTGQSGATSRVYLIEFARDPG